MSDIRFNAEDHSYWIGDTRLESVTTLIKSLSRPFDRDAVSKHSAAKANVSQEQILAEWDKKSQESLDRGTMVHSYVDDIFSGQHDLILSEMNVKIPEMQAFDGAWAVFRSRLNARLVRKEFIVGSAELGVAGRVDVMLAVDLECVKTKCLFDWKTGKFQRSNRFSNLLPPFDDQDDCELVKYSLQLSLYRLLLEKSEPDDIYGNGYLVHLKSDGTYFIHRAIDFRNRLEAWLKERVQQ